jgi:hypothetical protein
MCWQAALPLLLSAGGTALQYSAQNDARRRQDRETAAGIMRQAEMSRQASQKVSENVQELSQSNPEGDIQSQRAAYVEALRRSQPTRDSATPAAGNVSDRFSDSVGVARTEGEAEARDTADTMARVEAPTYQRLRENQGAADVASQLGLIQGRSAGQDYLTRLRVALTQPNQGQMAAGSVLSGFGNAAAANGGFSGFGASPWDDGTAASGLTAVQRRQRWMGA